MAKPKGPEAGGSSSRGFYKAIKAHRHSFQPAQVVALLALADKGRVELLSKAISMYLVKNLPDAIERRERAWPSIGQIRMCSSLRPP